MIAHPFKGGYAEIKIRSPFRDGTGSRTSRQRYGVAGQRSHVESARRPARIFLDPHQRPKDVFMLGRLQRFDEHGQSPFEELSLPTYKYGTWYESQLLSLDGGRCSVRLLRGDVVIDRA